MDGDVDTHLSERLKMALQDSAHRLLIVEDDSRLGRRLSDGLREAGYTVDLVRSLAEAQVALGDAPPSLLILDLGLPDGDGQEWLHALRRERATFPVIITTARDGLKDRIKGLEDGADDYLVKPYAFEELLARIRIQLRHSEGAQLKRSVGALNLDLQTRTATVNGVLLDLTPREFDLLAFLTLLRGDVATRDMIQKRVWNVASRMTSMDNVIDVHLSRLRKKLEGCPGAPVLKVIRGVGVALKENA